MEESESLESEVTELQEFQSEASEAISQDSEDEVEELQNSLREVVQDPTVKPQIQCLMVDPSFSMVTVQSEDSGIVWETASSRCSTPWASETSSISEAYSMEGPGAAGKITIVFDEDKIVRRRTRSGRSSRLGDRLSRPGSRSASALGVERPEMAQISLPNVKQEKTETEPDLEEIKNKDQQLFSLISEGYEILNIRVPSKLPTVDEEESTELQDNLSYLDQTPKIKSRNNHVWTLQQDHALPEVEVLDQQEPSKQDSSQPSTDTELRQKESTGDIDYFEKFTLVDVVVPGEQAPETQEEEVQQPVTKPQVEEQKLAKETATDSPSASEESFVFVTDVDIVGEHLDEVFYGEGAPAESLQRREDDEDEGGARMRRESQRSVKENGSVLFGSEDTVLTPIYISPGPPKIIDLILLEEPRAMSFMYSDLYEDAVGERRRSDEEHSEAESVASEKTYKRRLSDSEDADGYLEKFTLKDETPTVEAPPEIVEKTAGRTIWSQNRFDMTGCLTRVVREEDEHKLETEEPKAQEVRAGDGRDLQPATFEEKREIITETQKEREEIQLSVVAEEQSTRQKSEELVQESKLREDQVEDQEVKREVKSEQTQQVDSTVKKSEARHREESAETTPITKTAQSHQTQKVVENAAHVDVKAAEATDVVLPVHSKSPQIINESSVSEKAANDTEIVAAKDKLETKAVAEATAEVKETSTDIETSIEIPLCEKKEAAQIVTEDVAPVEVITDCDSTVHALVEVTEKAVDEKDIQTQVQIDLQDITGTADVQTSEIADVHGALSASLLPEIITKTDQELEAKPETSSEVNERAMPEDVKPDSGKTQDAIPESKEPQQEETVAVSELMTEAKDKTPTGDSGTVAQLMVNDDDELILLVPKGQAVEMDIGTGQLVEKTTSDTVALSESDTCEHLIAPETTTTCPETQAPDEETMTEPQMEVKPVTVLPTAALERRFSPPAPEEETDTQEQKLKWDFEEDEGVFSPMRSFTPQEDLSGLHSEDTKSEVADVEQKADMHEVEKALESSVVEEHLSTDTDLHRQDVEQKMEQDEAVTEASEVTQVTVEEPEVCAKEPEVSAKEPEVSAKEPEVSSKEPKVSSKEPEVSAKEPKVSAKEPEVSAERPEVSAKKPKVSAKEPEVSAKEPEVSAKEPEVSAKEPEVSAKEPEVSAKEPEVSAKKPEVSAKEPEVSAKEPEVSTKEPEVSAKEPEVSTERPVVSVEEPEMTAEEPDVSAEELDYEIISKQDAKEMPEPETQRELKEPKPVSGQEIKERMEMEEEEEFEVSPEEEEIEADYEMIDAEEESQARLAAELQGMDWFCITCECLLSEEDRGSGEHHSHQVTSVDQAYEDIKERLSDWISELQGRSENIEDLVSELELAYNSVEDQFVESEAAMQAQNEEMMALVMDQYNDMSVSMEEEKKAKLEQLYDQIVSFQEGIDCAKATLETTAREAETDARSPEDIHASLKAALDSAMSLELGPKSLLVFEDYAKGNTSSPHLAQRKGIPVPQRPTLQAQESGSATSTSVTVYWKVNPGDIIDCFQVYCMEDPQGAVSEEYRVTVKESYCVLEELEPDRTYKVWVMAVNYTGCSLPSERLCFRTAPSVPVIDTERCTVLWDSATLRWSSVNLIPEQSYTLEYCRQYELEGEGLRSISGIRDCEQRVLLQPNENYLFYIKAVNESGASEQSEAALISTKGTKFHLLKASAHPALELSVDQTTLHYSLDAHENTQSTDQQCPSVLGELLPAQGHYYWETLVSESTAYRLGVAYNTANRNSPLGENSLSWCLRCLPTPSGCRYQLLHNDVQSSVFVIEMPERVGTLLDYQLGRLSFYNAQSGQLLGSFCQRFTQPCHAALALEEPGSLEVSMVLDVPEFTKDS